MTKDIRREDRPALYCIELRTSNWPKLVDWYRNVLGLRVLVRVVDDEYALLEAGDNRLAIVARQTPGEATIRISLAFEVSNVQEIVARMRVAGAPVSYPARDPEGLREAETADPDGNRIRLFSWPGG